MNTVRKITALILAAGTIFTAAVSCSPQTGNTSETSLSDDGKDNSGTSGKSKENAIDEILEFPDIDFKNDNCHGISFSSDLKGPVIVTCDDVEEPEIRVKVDFRGGTKKKRKEEFENLGIKKELNEEGVLMISFIDESTGYSAQSSYNPFKQEFEGVLFSHAESYVEMTLPRDFDTFYIVNYNGDIGAKDLGGSVGLFSYNTITGENIAFDASEDNMVDGDKGVILSTKRYHSVRTEAIILSRYGDITYVMPKESEMTGRSEADSIKILCSEGTLTIDLNGNACGDTSEVDKDKNMRYDYSVAHGAAKLDAEAYGGGVNITNGSYRKG